MKALKWAAGLALGNDPNGGSPPFRSRRSGSLMFHLQQVEDGGTPSREEDSEGDLGRRPRSGGSVGTTQAVGPRASRGEGGWMNDDSSASCLLCDAPFTFTNRRHHCRQCLKLVCSACSSNMWQLDSGRRNRGGAASRRAAFKRVCDKCYATLVATREVLSGGDTTTRDSGEHMHFEVIVHETVGRGQTRGNTPPAVPVGPSSPRPGMETPAAGDVKLLWGDAGIGKPSSGGGGLAAEAAPRLPGSEVLNRARAPYCRLTVANKQVGKTRSVPQPLTSSPTAGGGGAGRQRFEQNFLFRVSCACRTADYLVLEVYDTAGGLSTGADPLLGHCRVPLFRTGRHGDHTFWHMLLEADGAAAAVGRALVTVRNLGAGSIPRPAWGHSLPGGGGVVAPPPPPSLTKRLLGLLLLFIITVGGNGWGKGKSKGKEKIFPL